MKKASKFLVLLTLILSLVGCGDVSSVTLQERTAIPEDGLLSVQLLEQIKEQNAITVFFGESGGLSYEWTIFGSDIEDVREVDLRLAIEPAADGLEIRFSEDTPFGFPALLSIHLDEKWDAPAACAYQNDLPVYSLSLTGTKATILNLAVGETLGSLVILPELVDEGEVTTPTNEPQAHPEVPAEQESYLSDVKPGDYHVYEGVKEEVETPAEKEEYLSAVKDSSIKSQTTPDEISAEEGPAAKDSYLSAVQDSSGRVYSSGSGSGKDQYLTDPIPAGKPVPVEPEDQEVNSETRYTCTFSIECATILNNLDQLDPDKLEMVPSGGVVLSSQTVTFYEGESVFDVLQRVCRENGIHLESSWTPIYNSAYIEGIHNLYEFDCGSLSGWMYRVNGWYPNYGCSRYQLAQGDRVEWRYTCDLGKDIGGQNVW